MIRSIPLSHSLFGMNDSKDDYNYNYNDDEHEDSNRKAIKYN